MSFKVDWCSYEAAKYAVEHWHYSRSMPVSKVVSFGVWEYGNFIGAILYSWGANKNIGKPYDLPMTQVCELTRVALTVHTAPVSQIVGLSIRLFKKHNPGVRLIVSYADLNQGHLGTIYQALNWLYVGIIKSTPKYEQAGKQVHQRTMSNRGSIAGLKSHAVLGKHKYLYPLDKEMRLQIMPLSKPYPKKDALKVNGVTTNYPLVESGSSPT